MDMSSEIITSTESNFSLNLPEKYREKSPFEGRRRLTAIATGQGSREMMQTFLRCLGWTIILFASVFVLGIAQNTRAQDPPSPGSGDAVEDSLVLHRYIQEALANNPQIEGLFQQYYARMEQVPQVGALPDPEIMFQYHINPMEQSNPLTRTTVSATQRFPWFGTLNKREERVKKVADVEWTAFEEARNEIVQRVKKRWYRIHELHHHLMIFRQNMDLLGQLKRQVQRRYESGDVSQVDLLRIQIEQDNLETRIVNTEEELEAMKVHFNSLLNRPAEAEVYIPDVMYSSQLARSEERLRQVIYNRNPELRGRELQEEAALVAEEQARLEGRPSFGLGLMVMNKNFMYMPLMSGERAGLTGSLTIRLPLSRSKYRAQRQEARIEARIAREEQQEVTDRLTAETESLLQQYRDADRRIALHEERLIPQTRQALRIALSEYAGGRGDFEQIIQLQQQLLKYEMMLNTAYVEQNIAIAEIEALAGEYNATPEEMEIE
ncbi:Outer membrane protein TolC [Fodinibius roseus]|uniref:Outer membrane protein TolC n=1 Tax=Fodinibius roseus TaxID=1194090 RepID=A0A1M4UXZ4_9BACT|nr:TolC family protein [Fodinibius roseus]SHE61545.1 Outer membrane protein TolC [Fodinibius roseus]